MAKQKEGYIPSFLSLFFVDNRLIFKVVAVIEIVVSLVYDPLHHFDGFHRIVAGSGFIR
jgi:hypothetical protein